MPRVCPLINQIPSSDFFIKVNDFFFPPALHEIKRFPLLDILSEPVSTRKDVYGKELLFIFIWRLFPSELLGVQFKNGFQQGGCGFEWPEPLLVCDMDLGSTTEH